MSRPQPLTKESIWHAYADEPEWLKVEDVLSALKGLQKDLVAASTRTAELNGLTGREAKAIEIAFLSAAESIKDWFPILQSLHLEESEDKSTRLGETLSGSTAPDKSGVEAMSRGSSDSRSNPLFDRKAVGGSEIDEQHSYIANAIHWPDCWDTMAYPTILDALWEIVQVKGNCPTCLKDITSLSQLPASTDVDKSKGGSCLRSGEGGGENAPAKGLISLEQCRTYWNEHYGVVKQENGVLELHSGGWSENEELIDSLDEKAWQLLVRAEPGGHYWFKDAGASPCDCIGVGTCEHGNKSPWSEEDD